MTALATQGAGAPTAAPVGVGLIGFGYAGRTFHAPLIGATPGLRLTAVASSDATKVHAALGDGVQVLGATELIARDDIALVVIATPNELHHPMALAALRAGRHVVVDKPFALSLAQARELEAAAQAAGRLLSVFHNRRWDSDFLTLAHLLREGRLGRPVELASHFDRYRPQVRDRWREGSGPGAGLWLDLGPHLVDQALQLFGMPQAVQLDSALLRDGALADDWFDCRLRWGPGAHAGLRVRLHASTLAARPGPRFTLHGTGGSFVVEGLDAQEDALKAGAGPAQIASADWGRELRQGTLWLPEPARGPDAMRSEALPLQPGAYPAYYAQLLQALRGQGANPVRPGQAVAVQAVLEAGVASARARCEVEFTPH